MHCLLQASIAVLALLTLVQAQKATCEVDDPPEKADFCAEHGSAHLGCKNKGVREGKTYHNLLDSFLFPSELGEKMWQSQAHCFHVQGIQADDREDAQLVS